MHTQWNTTKMGCLSLLLASLAVPQGASANVALRALVTHGGQMVPISGNTVLDAPFTMNCPVAAGCTLIIEGIGTIGDNPGGANEWILCAQVDGNSYYGCTVQGLMRTDTQLDHGWTTGSTREVFQVTPGNHTVQFKGYASSTATMAQWQAFYYMYK